MPSPLDGVELRLVDSWDEAQRFTAWLGERRPVLGVDIETTGLSLTHDRIRLCQFGDARTGWAIPWDDWRGMIREKLSDYDRPLVGHHFKFDAGFLQRQGVTFRWDRVHDTMVMAFIANSMGPKALKTAAGFYVDPSCRAGEKELRAAMVANRWSWDTVPITFPAYWGYAAADTVITALLAERLWPDVQYARAAYDLELACERVLCDMEMRGVRIDVDYVTTTRERLIREHEDLLDELAPLNPNAPQQVVDALVSLGIDLRERTRSGNLSVKDDVLREIDHPLAQRISLARDYAKLIGSYFDNFLEYRDGDVLHPHINQIQARTGRMSVSQPALQQVPRQALVRDAFIPREGNRLVLVDYDNEELRVAAHVCRDRNMMDAFLHDRDLHAETAARVYGVALEDVTKGQRTVGKRGMFSKAYGAGVSKFARTVGLSEADGHRVFNVLNELYPGMNQGAAAITQAVRQRAITDNRDTGYVVLSDGRKLRVPVDKAYVGFNYRIQGECAVVMKRALVDLDAAGFGPYLALPIHDEVVFDMPEDMIVDAIPEIENVMRQDTYAVPLTASAAVVDRWGAPYREVA